MTRFHLVVPALVATLGLTPAKAADLDAPLAPQAPLVGTGPGVYLGLRGGINAMSNTRWAGGTQTVGPTGLVFPSVFDRFGNLVVGPSVYNQTVTTTTNITDHYKTGGLISGQLGYDFGEFSPGFGARVEADFGAFANKVGSAVLSQTIATTNTFVSGAGTIPLNTTVTTSTLTGANGTTTVAYGLANYYVDVLLGRFKPYFGFGIGLANVDFSNHAANGTVFMNTDRWTWAYQVGGGIGFDLTQNITLEIGYRHMVVKDVKLNSVLGASSKLDIRNQQALLGLRVRF